MAYGAERFLTTHTGSLPRPDDLIRAMFAKEEGVPVDRAALDVRIRSAVAEIVNKQTEAGIDLVNDGEMSKPSYATYVKDRLSGFAGTSNTFVYQDLAEFPDLAQRCSAIPAGRAAERPPAPPRSRSATRRRPSAKSARRPTPAEARLGGKRP